MQITAAGDVSLDTYAHLVIKIYGKLRFCIKSLMDSLPAMTWHYTRFCAYQ